MAAPANADVIGALLRVTRRRRPHLRVSKDNIDNQTVNDVGDPNRAP
jgi:hypothetical protein